MEKRFGIPKTAFHRYLLFKGGKSWHVVRYSPGIQWASQLKVSQVGIRAFQQVGRFVKPSTRFIQSFGHMATRARFRIDRGQLSKLLAGEELPFPARLDDGYVILCLGEDRILGLGLFLNGRVRSLIPRKEIRATFLEK